MQQTNLLTQDTSH